MSLNENFTSAWEELYISICKYIAKKADITVALVHCFLVSEVNFRCIGNGEDKILVDEEIGSEDLPEGWNENNYRYALRYVSGNRLYILFGHMVNDCILLNILNVSTGKVSNILLNPENLLNNNISTILERIWQELVEPVITQTKTDATTQTDGILTQNRYVMFNRNANNQQVIRNIASEMPLTTARNASDVILRRSSNVHNFSLRSSSLQIPFHPVHIHEQERSLRLLHSRQPSNENAIESEMDIVSSEPSAASSSISSSNSVYTSTSEHSNNIQTNIPGNIDNTNSPNFEQMPQTSRMVTNSVLEIVNNDIINMPEGDNNNEITANITVNSNGVVEIADRDSNSNSNNNEQLQTDITNTNNNNNQ